MAASGPSPHLSHTRSCQMAGRPVAAPRRAPAVKIRSGRSFAASGSEVSLAPARLPRPLIQRRNALREKASQPLPPLVVRHQGASRSGDAALASGLEELGVIGDAEKAPLLETGSVIPFEVDEDEIISESVSAESEGSGHLESMPSGARVTAMELESSECVAPNSSHNRSLFYFAAADRMGSSVLNGEVSVAQRSMPLSRSVIWSGFAALCAVCIAFFASKLSRSGQKAQLPRKLFAMHKPEVKDDEFDKANLNVFRNGQECPDGLLRRPQLDRKALMSNIKKAQDSRKWFVLNNSFCRIDISPYDDMNIPEMRRNVEESTSEQGILEKYCAKEMNDIVIPQPIDEIVEEVSANYSSQSYVHEVSDSSETNGHSLYKHNIDESMEQTIGLTDGAQIMNMNQGNIGDIDVPDPSNSNEGATSTDDRNSIISTLEKEAEIGSANVHESSPNSASTPSEFDIKVIDVSSNSVNIAHTACPEEFSHNMSMVASKTPAMAKTRADEPADLRKNNAKSIEEVEPSIFLGNVKQLSPGIEKEHKEIMVHNHNETQIRTETEHTVILNNTGTSSFGTLQDETAQNTSAEVLRAEKKQVRNKPRAHIRKKKSKLQTNSDKEAETELSEQGQPGSKTMVNSTSDVEKTKRVSKKRQKKVQSQMQIVPMLDDVQCGSMVDQKNNSQHVKKARRKNPKNVFHNQDAQIKEENQETAQVISSPNNTITSNVKPLGMADSSVETQLSKTTDAFNKDQPNGSSPSTMRKEELKLNI